MIKDENIISEFMQNVDVPEDPDGCWFWKGKIHPTGYGVYSKSHGITKTDWAHRISWMVFKEEPLVKGLVLDHFKCYNKCCVNPAHLRQVTQEENSKNKSPMGLAKMREVGKLTANENNGMCKISNEDVIKIRTMYATGNYTQTQIIQELNLDCSKTQISRIINHKLRKVIL